MSRILVYAKDNIPVPDDGTELASIEPIINPLIVKELNGCYTFSFDVLINDDTKIPAQSLIAENIVQIDSANQLRNFEPFRIQKITKNRSAIPTISVYCEHLSYDLLEDDDDTKKFVGTMQEMLNTLMEHLPFNPKYVSIENGWFVNVGYITPIKTYIPKSKKVRQRLLDICALFNVEIDYNYLDIYVYRPIENEGANNLIVNVGENLINLTETQEFENGMTTKTYDVDVLDLGVLKVTPDLSKLRIGHWVELNDDDLGISTSLRILRVEVDPFNIVNAKIQVGKPVADLSTRDQEIENNLTTIKSDIIDLKESISGDPGTNLEFASTQAADATVTFNFSQEYDEILSITTGIGGSTVATVKTSKIKVSGKYTGVSVIVTGGGSDTEVSIQAVCKVVV